MAGKQGAFDPVLSLRGTPTLVLRFSRSAIKKFI